MMMARKFFIIGAIMIASLPGAQAFAAGGDDYAPTVAKPAAYNKALVLIKDRYYKSALALDVKHKGALEYQGKLFLMLGDKASAEKNLQKLDKICWLGCGELDDLRTAIRNYKP